MDDTINELDKKTLKSYVKKAGKQLRAGRDKEYYQDRTPRQGARRVKYLRKAREKIGEEDMNEDETVAEPAPEPAPNAYQMVNLIGNVVDQKPSEFATTFDQIMKDRITQKVADHKLELTRDVIAAPAGDDEDDEPEADEPEEEPEVKEPDENGEPIEEPDEEDYPIDDDAEEEQPPPETAKTEEVEPVNELSKKILGPYIKRASRDARYSSYGAGLGVGGSTKMGKYRTNIDTAHKRFDKSEKRQKGIDRATDRLTKEDMSDSDKKKVSTT